MSGWLKQGFVIVIGMTILSSEHGFAQSKEGILTAKILLRSLAFDRNVARLGHPNLVIAVLTIDAKQSKEAKDMVAAFKKVSARTVAGRRVDVQLLQYLGPEDLASKIKSKQISAIYISVGLSELLPNICKVTGRTRVSTLAGRVHVVKQGASIGVVVRKGRPKLLVNLKSSRSEGMSLEAEMLKLAEIIE